MVFCCILHCFDGNLFFRWQFTLFFRKSILRFTHFCVEKNLAKNSARGEKWQIWGMSKQSNLNTQSEIESLVPRNEPKSLANVSRCDISSGSPSCHVPARPREIRCLHHRHTGSTIFKHECDEKCFCGNWKTADIELLSLSMIMK